MDNSLANQQAAQKEFYSKLAQSASGINDVLPSSLWGKFDSLRMLAKLIGRRIYLVTATTDQMDVHLNVFNPQMAKWNTTKFASVAMHQPGIKD